MREHVNASSSPNANPKEWKKAASAAFFYIPTINYLFQGYAMSSLITLKQELQAQASFERAEQTRRFFKVGKGEYSEHDQFIGIAVPTLRKIAKQWPLLSLEQTGELLVSKIHEERFLALLILILQYEKGGENRKEAIFQFLLTGMDKINNWDLVDTIAPKVIGPHLFKNKREFYLNKWAASSVLWERRIAVVSTWYAIRQGNFIWTLTLIKTLKDDPHPLIHKALGWMLREVGKKDRSVLIDFLEVYRDELPRITLSYALEKFSKEERILLRQGGCLKI